MSGITIDQEYEVVQIDGDNDPLKEHPQNPNKGNEEIIEESIDVNGWYGAITAQKSTGYIIAGNHRYRIAKRKGATEVPVIWRDVDDETALKILLVDNKSTREGVVDEAMLEELLAGLDTLDGTGYVLASAQERIESTAEPEASGDEPEVPDDKYEPEFGVIIVCKSERQQQMTYEWLVEQLPKRADQIRVIAV